MDIIDILPVKVLRSQLCRDFSSDELSILLNDNSAHYMSGNRMTTNGYILDSDERLLPLKSFIEDTVRDYYSKIYSNFNAIPKITQSWVNFTNPGEFHHIHTHRNSIISGVLYINTSDSDSITFIKSTDSLSIDNNDRYNLPVKSKELILFPSNILHMVPRKESIGTRISLAFNSWFTGSIGSDISRTELYCEST